MGRLHIHTATGVLFAVILALPLLQTLTGALSEPVLNGATLAQKRPSLSAADWWQGRYQKAMGGWFGQHLGFRAFWVRNANQIELSLNGKLSTRTGTSVVVGKNRWLYEKIYVDAYSRPPFWSQRDIQTVSRSLAQLQAALAQRKIALLVLVSPSKATTYPEYLPEAVFNRPRHGGHPPDHRRAVVQMKSDGVNVLDATEVLATTKSTSQHPVFAEGGTHWNRYGAYRVLEAAVENLNRHMTTPFPEMTCLRVDYHPPLPAESDLADLLNIWFRDDFTPPVPYPVVKVPGPGPRPELLMVGSSFMWALLQQLDDSALTGRSDFLYYYKRRFAYPGRRPAPFDPRRGDWSNLLLAKSAVIIEVNETSFPLIYPHLVADLTAAASLPDS